MKISSGDYITFIAPDDFIDINIYEKCIESIIQYNADIVVYQIHLKYLDKQKIFESKIYINDLLSAIKENKIFPSCCNKVFKRKVIENIYFFDDMKYAEDLLFRDMALPKVSIIVLVPNISYHYRNIRIGSIENSLKKKAQINPFIKGVNNLFNYYKSNNYYKFMNYIFENG